MSEGEIAFSDSEWVVVTDFTFDSLDQVINSLHDWLDVRVNTLANHYDGPKNQLKQALQQHIEERAQLELTKLQKSHQRLNKLKAAVTVQESRIKRGLEHMKILCTAMAVPTIYPWKRHPLCMPWSSIILHQ